jgi:hypothetical protein
MSMRVTYKGRRWECVGSPSVWEDVADRTIKAPPEYVPALNRLQLQKARERQGLRKPGPRRKCDAALAIYDKKRAAGRTVAQAKHAATKGARCSRETLNRALRNRKKPNNHTK